MALTDNFGTQVYLIPCGVPSDPGVDTTRNYSTNYFYLSVLDFILWGQGTHYVHVSSNHGNNYYFLECNVPSDPGLVLTSNAGTHFYYSSSFNCVSWCLSSGGGGGGGSGDLLFNGASLVYNGIAITYNGA